MKLPMISRKKTKSLQPKSLADWPVDIDFDDKEEVLTIDANGNTTLVSGIILPIDVWSNSDLKYYMETHCPLGEKNWHAIDNHIKGRIVTDMRDHFVIPNGVEYDNQALKRANKFLKTEQLGKVGEVLGFRESEKFVYSWKKARAFVNQLHRSSSYSFANQQADYEDEHGEKMSLLSLWIKAHTGKDGSFLPDTVTAYFVDDVNAKVEELRMFFLILPDLLNKTSQFLGMANQQVEKDNLMNTGE
uniref:Uncharacterized protein n=1 Tax=Chenopodium quinoa TaxID=63459 RepID=A0A803NE59_CHEQI